ncbi:TAXI family TRAP transporter solute-binding subunit [soil metagenome]
MARGTRVRSGRFGAALLLAFVSTLLLTACGAPSDSGSGGDGGGGGNEENFQSSLQLGTGSTGGVYFPLGQELANIWEDNVEAEGFGVNAVETGASVDNLASISQGQLQVGIAQNNTGVQAVNGEGEFDGAAVDNVGFMGQLYPEAIQVITLESTGIESIEDLEGKRVAVGPPGGATREAADLVLGAYGIEDYQATQEGFDDAKAKLQDGNIDASIEVLGVPGSSVQQLEASTGEAVLLPISDEAISNIEETSGYESYEIPASAYDFLDGPVQTVSAFACMFGSTNQVSEDLGYKLTKSMYENADQFTLPQKEFITVEDALTGRGELPLHPGAERYFEEEGVLNQ